MEDDLNIASALAALFRFTSQINTFLDRGGISSTDKDKVLECLKGIDSVLGFMNISPVKPDEKVEDLIKKRDTARMKKDWGKADQIRRQLEEMGIELTDTRGKTTWRKK